MEKIGTVKITSIYEQTYVGLFEDKYQEHRRGSNYKGFEN